MRRRRSRRGRDSGGLAYAGKIPFVSSFSAFVINKGFEQLRVVVAYPNTNVKVVGTHSGISIGEDGPSQISVEEIGLACSLPGFLVFSPADEMSMKAIMASRQGACGSGLSSRGPDEGADLLQPDQKFEIGKAVQLTDGKDVTINGRQLIYWFRNPSKPPSNLTQGISSRVLDFRWRGATGGLRTQRTSGADGRHPR